MDNQFTDRIAEASGLSPEQVHACLAALAKLTADAAQPIPDAADIDEVERFWQCFADAVKAGRLVDSEDYRTDGGRLAIIWGRAYLAYQLHYRNRYGRDGMAKTWLIAQVKKHPCYVTVMPSMWIGKTKSSVMLFDRPTLPVPIPASVPH